MKTYNALLTNLKELNIPIKETEFNEQAFGSWYIEIESSPSYRVVHDGRDKTIVLEKSNNNEWSSVMYDKTKSGKHVIERIVKELK
ncbi:MAG: hypothetical protein PVJ72_16765 [Gammaproteobacteria bacterium]|jgi:hypothetical protein